MKTYALHSRAYSLFIIISILFSSKFYQAQDQAYIDSLHTVVKTQEGASLVNSYRKLYVAHIHGNPEKAKIYVDSSMTIADRLNDKSLVASTSNDYAVYLEKIADYNAAIIAYDKALKIFEELGDKERISTTLNNKGTTLGSLGRFRQELETHLRSLKIKESLKLEDPNEEGIDYWDESLAASYWNIGNVHGDLQNLEKSNEYYYKALAIYDRLNLVDDSERIKENIAINLGGQGKHQEAISMHKESIKYLSQNKFYYSAAMTYGNLSKSYFKVDSISQAKETIKEALLLKDEHNDITLYGLHKRYQGNIWLKEKKYKKALANYKEALSISQEKGRKDQIINDHLKVAETYSKLGDYKRAYENLSLYKELHSEIFSKETLAKINELEILYQTEKKEKELIIEKDKVAILEKEAEVSDLQRLLLASGLFIALSSIFFVWYSSRQKEKLAQQEKEKLDTELAFKKKELTTHALHLAKKNELLEGLKNKAQALRNESEEKNGYRQLIRTIDFDLQDDNNWESFANYFQQVHKDFNQNVTLKYPDVTPNELRLISLVKMNLSIKEMANILNISVGGVKKARQRLRKKMNLSTKDSLEKAVLMIP